MQVRKPLDRVSEGLLVNIRLDSSDAVANGAIVDGGKLDVTHCQQLQ